MGKGERWVTLAYTGPRRHGSASCALTNEVQVYAYQQMRFGDLRMMVRLLYARGITI